MRRVMRRICLATVLIVALQGCGISQPGNVAGLRRVVGADLVGARGASPEDQRKIDRTVVGLCAAHVWTRGECASHGEGR